MKICVIGAGAIGGLMGAKLALAGEEITFIEREGPHLAAINKNGLKLLMHGGEELVVRDFKTNTDMDKVGKQDIVIIAVKTYQIPPIAAKMRALFEPGTVVITIQNGLPWWYFHKHGGEFEGQRIHAVDPTGEIDANIEPERIIGCIAYPAAEVDSPGIIKHIRGNRFPVGELDGSHSDRIERISQILCKAGFKSFVLDDIRSEIWLKAWGNLSFNPISALTHATMVDICQFSATRELATQMMAEAQTIANKLGIQFRHSIEKRTTGAESMGKHKTSMLQDVEAGRELEIEALVGAVVELGRLTHTPTPHIDAIYACTKLLGKIMHKSQDSHLSDTRTIANTHY